MCFGICVTTGDTNKKGLRKPLCVRKNLRGFCYNRAFYRIKYLDKKVNRQSAELIKFLRRKICKIGVKLTCNTFSMTAFVCLDFPKFIAVKMLRTLKSYFVAGW
ncbi:MAG TPA: hypothetical protein DDY77_05060 [Clostridiales bacterium]|nr:hypothetical protein [Clostridiales bacterium]